MVKNSNALLIGLAPFGLQRSTQHGKESYRPEKNDMAPARVPSEGKNILHGLEFFREPHS
jgi:hypothetical protein